MKRICNRQLKLSRDDKINDRRSQKLTATDIVSMSAMTHCQWAAGYHGNRTSEHSRPDHVVTFHGTFQLKPMCCPHSQSQCNSFCVCLSADQGREVCVCEKSVNSVWITSQVVFHCVNQGYILGQWPIFYYDFCLYTCAVWYIGCVWSCDVYIVRDQNPTVTIPHYSAVKHGHHWSNQITNKYQRLVEPLSRILLELIIETRVAYPSPTNKSSSIIFITLAKPLIYLCRQRYKCTPKTRVPLCLGESDFFLILYNSMNFDTSIPLIMWPLYGPIWVLPAFCRSWGWFCYFFSVLLTDMTLLCSWYFINRVYNLAVQVQSVVIDQ